MISPEQRDRMLIKAIQAHGFRICPCDGRKFSECYTVAGDTVVFWFNDRDTGSTHVVLEPLAC